MHEAGITAEIIEIAAEKAAGARVKRIVLEIGKLSAILPDAVRFAFEAMSPESPVAGAVLEIREIPGQARCRACSAVFPLETPLGLCACGGTDLEWLSGEELRLKELEVL
jgi:hydrogenase nickel incorporation protein HypA/HybF